MQMVPLYSKDWTILGHVDLDMCLKSHTFVVVDNSPYCFTDGPVSVDTEVMSPVEIYRIPRRGIVFCRHGVEKTTWHLVVDEKDLPPWFWDCKAIVKFSPEFSYQALYG